MQNANSRHTIGNENAVVLGVEAFQPGIAAGIDIALLRRKVSGSRATTGNRLKFFVGEVLGIFFILTLTAYILGMPSWLARQGELKAIMGRAIKRIVDVVGALVGMLLTLPLWLVLPVLIKLDSAGPVFYQQVRVGVNRRRSKRRYHQKAGMREGRSRDRRREDYLGRPFKVIKFRTMVNNAEQDSGPIWAAKNDNRVTSLGAILRKTRLDEIPQFINILKGDMSLVGPRPERPNFVIDLSTKVENYTTRLQVKPGLTGLAQVENGYDSSLASVVDKVGFDLQYIRNRSIFADLRIILKTVVVVVTGRGAC